MATCVFPHVGCRCHCTSSPRLSGVRAEGRGAPHHAPCATCHSSFNGAAGGRGGRGQYLAVLHFLSDDDNLFGGGGGGAGTHGDTTGLSIQQSPVLCNLHLQPGLDVQQHSVLLSLAFHVVAE